MMFCCWLCTFTMSRASLNPIPSVLPYVCRRTDKQPMTVPDEEDEDEDVQELALDDVLMLDQEPEPGIDLDDAQRPRLSRV